MIIRIENGNTCKKYSSLLNDFNMAKTELIIMITKIMVLTTLMSIEQASCISAIRLKSSLHTPLHDFHVAKGGKMVDFAG